MRKRLAGVVTVTAATFLTIYSTPPQIEEIVQEFSVQKYENQESHLLKGEPVVNQVSVTLIEPVDGDTIHELLNPVGEH